jgi:hypothetical protein
MFKTLKKAGLSIDEGAFILGVSRAAVFNWKSGRSKPHKLLQGRLVKFEHMLESLLKQNKLPLPAADADARKGKIEKLKSIFDKFTGAQ